MAQVLTQLNLHPFWRSSMTNSGTLWCPLLNNVTVAHKQFIHIFNFHHNNFLLNFFQLRRITQVSSLHIWENWNIGSGPNESGKLGWKTWLILNLQELIGSTSNLTMYILRYQVQLSVATQPKQHLATLYVHWCMHTFIYKMLGFSNPGNLFSVKFLHQEMM